MSSLMSNRGSLVAVSAVLLIAWLVQGAGAGAGSATRPAVADPADPLPAGQAPAFREVLRGAKWDEPYANALAALGDLDALAKSPALEAGLALTNVDPSGQGKQLGLETGETVTAIDGQPIYLRDLWPLRRDKQQSLTVVATWGEPRQVNIAPGRIGTTLVPSLRPELVFLRHGPRKAAWDAFAAVGAAKCLSDPDLAETAWHHAIAASYVPDELSDFCGMQIAWRQGRNDDALRYLASMRARDDAYPWLTRDCWVRPLATANFKIEQAIGSPVAIEQPGTDARNMVDAYLRETLRAYRRRPAGQRLLPAPSQWAADPAHTTSLMDAMVPGFSREHQEDDLRRYVSDLLAKKGEYRSKAASGHFQRFLEIPRDAAPDVEVTFEVMFTASDKRTTQWGKIFAAGLVNCDRKECMDLDRLPAGGSMICAQMEPTGFVYFPQDSARQVPVQEVWMRDEVGRGQKFTLRFLHAAGRDEVWVNNRRIVYLPTEENPKKVGFFFGHVGTAVELKADYSRIDPDAAKP